MMADSILETTAVQIVVDDSQLDRRLREVGQRVKRFHREQGQSATTAATATQRAARTQVQAQSSVARQIEHNSRLAMTLRREYENNVVTKKEFIRQANNLRESLRTQSNEVTRGTREYDKAQLGMQRLSTAIATTEGRTSKLGISANIATGAQEGMRRALAQTGPAGRAASQGLGLVQGAFSSLQQPLDLSNMGLNRFMGIARAIPAVMATASIAVAGLAVAGMTRLANQAAQAADEVDKGAQSAGLSAEAYQELRFAFQQSGITAEQFNQSVQSLNRRLGLAAQGQKTYREAYERLGIAIRDANGEVRDTEDVITEAIDVLSRYKSSAEAAAEASIIFGDDVGKRLTPVINQGADGIANLRNQARELGLVMSGDSVQSLVEYKDQVATLQGQFETARVEIAASFLPLLRELVTLVQTQVVPRIQDLAGRVSDFVERLGGVDEASAAFRREMAANLAAAARFGNALIGIGSTALAVGQTVVGFAAGAGAALGQLSFELETNFLRTLGGILPDPGRAGDQFARSQLTPEQQEGLPADPERAGERIAEAFRTGSGGAFDSAQASLERAGEAFAQTVSTDLQGNIEDWLDSFFVTRGGASTIAGLGPGEATGTPGGTGDGGAGGDRVRARLTPMTIYENEVREQMASLLNLPVEARERREAARGSRIAEQARWESQEWMDGWMDGLRRRAQAEGWSVPLPTPDAIAGTPEARGLPQVQPFLGGDARSVGDPGVQIDARRLSEREIRVERRTGMRESAAATFGTIEQQIAYTEQLRAQYIARNGALDLQGVGGIGAGPTAELRPILDDSLTSGEQELRDASSALAGINWGDVRRDLETAAQDAAEAQRQAGFQFAQEVVQAGSQFVNAIQSFQRGDVGGGIAGLGQTASTVLGAASALGGSSLLGPIGTLIGAGTSIIGGLVGRPGADATEPSRAAGAASRGAPAMSVKLQVFQNIGSLSLAPGDRAQVDSLLDETVSRIEQVVTRSLAPRLNRVEERVDALAGA